MNGGSASKISLIEPTHASSRWGMNPSTRARAPARSSGKTFKPCVDERADQPCPDGALVIGCVARSQVAKVFRLIIRVIAAKRAQSDRSEQPISDNVEDRPPAFLFQNGMLQRNSQQLIRATGRI